MGNERALLFATDPPYAVGYDGRSHPQSWANRGAANRNKDWSGEYIEANNADVKNDPQAGIDLYRGFIRAALEFAIVRNAAWYLWHASKRHSMVEQVWSEFGAIVHQQIIWVKTRPVLTYSTYLWQHELASTAGSRARQTQSPKIASRRNLRRVSDNRMGGPEFRGRNRRSSDLETVQTLFASHRDAHRTRRDLLRAVLGQRLTAGRGGRDRSSLLRDRKISAFRRCRSGTDGRARPQASANRRTMKRQPDGRWRNARRAVVMSEAVLRARWVEAETINLKRIGLTFDAIAEQITRVGKRQAQAIVAIPDGVTFPPDFQISKQACHKAFKKALAREPSLAAEEFRKLDSSRCEEMFLNLQPGIRKGNPRARSKPASRCCVTSAQINGYAAAQRHELTGKDGSPLTLVQLLEAVGPITDENEN